METNTYPKKITCPICNKESTVSYPKKGSYRILNQDVDLNVNYEGLNPLFYSVFICRHCGYAARESKFDKIRRIQIDDIKDRVSSKWKNQDIVLPDEYDVNTAVTLHKLALLNHLSLNKPLNSELGIINLQLSWLYKNVNSKEEERFRKNALECLEQAYLNEDLPLGGVYNAGQSCYIIGSLNHLLGNDDVALRWLQDVILSKDSGYKLKEKARDLKSLIKGKD